MSHHLVSRKTISIIGTGSLEVPHRNIAFSNAYEVLNILFHYVFIDCYIFSLTVL